MLDDDRINIDLTYSVDFCLGEKRIEEKRKKGRKRTKKVNTPTSERKRQKKSYTCKICKQSGHNARTCKNKERVVEEKKNDVDEEVVENEDEDEETYQVVVGNNEQFFIPSCEQNKENERPDNVHCKTDDENDLILLLAKSPRNYDTDEDDKERLGEFFISDNDEPTFQSNYDMVNCDSIGEPVVRELFLNFLRNEFGNFDFENNLIYG